MEASKMTVVVEPPLEGVILFADRFLIVKCLWVYDFLFKKFFIVQISYRVNQNLQVFD